MSSEVSYTSRRTYKNRPPVVPSKNTRSPAVNLFCRNQATGRGVRPAFMDRVLLRVATSVPFLNGR